MKEVWEGRKQRGKSLPMMRNRPPHLPYRLSITSSRLQALPLNLASVGTVAAAPPSSASASAPEARTWMLPLLRRHVRGSEIGFWGRSLLPLARTLAARRYKQKSTLR